MPFDRTPRPWTTLLCLSLLTILTMPAANAALIFFGEDAAANQQVPANSQSVAAQQDFLSHLTGVRIEDFTSLDAGSKFPFGIDFGGVTATLDGTSTVGNTGITTVNISGRFPVIGDRYLNIGTADAAGFTLTFSQPQAAFGFFATDVGDFGGQLVIELDGSTSYIVDHGVGSHMTGALLFWGIIDTDNPFTSVNFANTDSAQADAFGFDGFTIGGIEQVIGDGPPATAVPTPAPIGIFVMLLGAVAFLRRRSYFN